MNRILALLIGCLILAVSAIVYLELESMGFPDGHLTEFDRAQKIIGNVFICISIPVSLWLFYLSRIASQQRITKRLRIAIALYAMFVLILLAINLYLAQHLDDGVGG